MTLPCFKAYDIRGRIPDELNEDIAYRVGRAYAEVVGANTVVVGHDIRLTSESLCDALAKGLTDSGVDVIHIGQCGTEEIYFATSYLNVGGGICVTASHNPMDYNGMKFVREESKPISGDSGLREIEAKTEANDFAPVSKIGTLTKQDTRPAYCEHLLGYINKETLKPLKIVCNAGNGGAGAVVDALEPLLPFEFIKVHHEPDGNFPNGVPNPLLEENRAPTSEAVKAAGADMGIAWDGDFDRCFFFDDEGSFVEGYYLVGLLAQAFLLKGEGESVVHDPRLTWNTIETVNSNGGNAVQSKTGHAFIKERMRKENAIYGGEMSAHHYFRDFAYCDSGMIPWLLVADLISSTGKTLKELVADATAAYPVSGEINRKIADAKAVLKAAEDKYAAGALTVEHVDGLSVEYADWRFNLRMSNTEPVVRLNVETKANHALMLEKRDELLALMDAI